MRTLLLLVAPIVCLSGAKAQETADKVLVDQHTLQTLLQRVDELEARVKQLEAGRQTDSASNRGPGAVSASTLQASGTPMPATTLGSSVTANSMSGKGESQPTTEGTSAAAAAGALPAHQEQEPSQSENIMAERMDLSKTLLRIRGFGDVNFGGDTQHGSTTAFALGQLDLFTTSDISEKFKFLSEIVFEGENGNIYGQPKPEGVNALSVDLERYVLQYAHNDYLNISAGRMHAAIGHYNTAYRHSTWLQTTTGGPLLFQMDWR